jgi:Phosphoadenosine phosphosulfate reductase family
VIDFDSYDRILVALSGGKDSIACVLHLLDLGVDPSKMELHHHLVDGREGSTLMDWAVTEDYVRQFAIAVGMPLYFSWKTGGFEGEMLREDAPTASTSFETPEGTVVVCGGNSSKLGTRRKFPQVCADLMLRWCSAYLKIMVMDAILTNSDRFKNSRTLIVTGERRQESANRAKYKEFEPHRADLREGKRYTRHIDHWRPVIDWDEKRVWDVMRYHGINPHPAYKLGFSRLSCQTCIFADEDQLASVYVIAPQKVEALAAYEAQFKTTIHRSHSVMERVAAGQPYKMAIEEIKIALAETYTQPIKIPSEGWTLPSGAFGNSTGSI